MKPAPIPFVREFEFEYGRCDRLSDRIRRVVAPNPGPFTFTGTGVYIVGNGEVAVIDPGPVLPAHEAALDAALDGERVSHVFVTHHHLDHSPMAHPLAAKHGCKVYGFGPQNVQPADGEVRLEAGDDVGFKPDIELADLEFFLGDDWTLQALHTPGHTSNHVCYALPEENVLFSGDHVMAWSTSVISPPDGDMGDYLQQLERIRDLGFGRLWPTHGAAVDDPATFIQSYIDHRLLRETQILDLLDAGQSSIRELVRIIYADVDRRLHPAAAHSVLAHMIHLVRTNRVGCVGEAGLNSTYQLARQTV
jgi:glyoxylase-like metal-dependent hydrolase (beta-lactamase superfamily II)